MKSAMVLMGENRGALSAVRSLGKRGIPVYVGAGRRLSKALYSKYCKKGFVYSSPYEEGFTIDKLHNELLKAVKKLRPSVLLPFGSDTTKAVLYYENEYKKYCKVVPSMGFNRFTIFNNKDTLIKEAIKVGCPVPKTYFPENLKELEKISHEINYPVLIKPRLSSGGMGITKASSKEELISKYKYTCSQKKYYFYDPTRPTIQEFIFGQRYSVTGVFDRGKEIGTIVFKNLKHYPTYGSPILNETVVNEAVRKPMVNLYKKLKWHGPANLQCIVDSKDNVTKLLEVNPRLWACMGSTIAAGLDAPYILYKMALGHKVKKFRSYKVNQKFRWILFGELFYWLKSRKKISLIKEYLTLKDFESDFDSNDIKPHIIQLLDLVFNRKII